MFSNPFLYYVFIGLSESVSTSKPDSGVQLHWHLTVLNGMMRRRYSGQRQIDDGS